MPEPNELDQFETTKKKVNLQDTSFSPLAILGTDISLRSFMWQLSKNTYSVYLCI